MYMKANKKSQAKLSAAVRKLLSESLLILG